MGKEIQPFEVRQKSAVRSKLLFQMVKFWNHVYEKWDPAWGDLAKHEVLIDRTRGVILQNPRPKDLRRVKKEENEE